MYEQSMKRAGIALNRILYANTKAVAPIFTQANESRFRFKFTIKNYQGGKMVSADMVTDNDLDRCFPSTKWAHRYLTIIFTLSIKVTPPRRPPPSSVLLSPLLSQFQRRSSFLSSLSPRWSRNPGLSKGTSLGLLSSFQLFSTSSHQKSSISISICKATQPSWVSSSSWQAFPGLTAKD